MQSSTAPNYEILSYISKNPDVNEQKRSGNLGPKGQVSILEPTACDGLLEVTRYSYETMAYADDCVLVIKGNSRKELEEK